MEMLIYLDNHTKLWPIGVLTRNSWMRQVAQGRVISRCSQPPDKPKLAGYAMKLDLTSLARLAGLRAVRYKIVGIQVT